jgi:large subunit ribosomal protein L4
VLDSLKLDEPRTKEIVKLLKALNVESAILALPEVDEIVIKSARNLPRIKTMSARQLNVADMLAYDKLLMTEAALRQVEELWGGVA